VILIPTPAIQRNAQGAFVYVIKDGQTASLRSITPGTTDGTMTAVQGIEPQEVVAINGFDRLLDGAKVMVRPPAGGGNGAPGQGQQLPSSGNQSNPSGTRGGSASGANQGGRSR
jgi:multidrug efflux system membrane fusion protein